MAEQNKPFVVTDRRKFTLDGTPRPDADRGPESEEAVESVPESTPASKPPIEFPSTAAPEAQTQAAAASEPAESAGAEPADMPPPPTAAEMDQVNAAYQQTSERLETAVRATNPGMERPPEMNFSQVVQSVYMTTILQLGGGTEPGQAPRVDLMGARQSIDMLAVLAEKTKGNLTAEEQRLLDSALFEVRMAFLEVTQALARSAAARTPGGTPGAAGAPGVPGRPTIVR
ncbi:MAG TPA: DUF1844 domain-containing protein [Acidobacteriaceae bacterium]|nr:DUF1844 domain-containing protein [Acidobacteriaceae bacterium]